MSDDTDRRADGWTRTPPSTPGLYVAMRGGNCEIRAFELRPDGTLVFRDHERFCGVTPMSAWAGYWWAALPPGMLDGEPVIEET